MQKFTVFSKRLVLIFLIFNACPIFPQDIVSADSTDATLTPFRKGRWLTSLSGSISSSRNQLSSTNDKIISNEFGINLSTGKFFKDRWLFGVTFQAIKEEAKGELNIVGESLYIGPQFARYFSKNKDGSLFLNVSPGFVLYRSLATINDIPDYREESDGDGFGTLISLGYSYVIRDLISFNIGFNLQYYWINADTINETGGAVNTENITISNISFTFGFGVILDDFFF
ncbi:autotransporter outer membrane beta-barrel domain-containing protein [Eudoraea sp.]|uniref:autotransporter outer membrane beta-barrel domain-containing protein n=1 Tax=Eudoraea sp. TaxID=1979955 RepID=UPI003C74CD57